MFLVEVNHGPVRAAHGNVVETPEQRVPSQSWTGDSIQTLAIFVPQEVPDNGGDDDPRPVGGRHVDVKTDLVRSHGEKSASEHLRL